MVAKATNYAQGDNPYIAFYIICQIDVLISSDYVVANCHFESNSGLAWSLPSPSAGRQQQPLKPCIWQCYRSGPDTPLLETADCTPPHLYEPHHYNQGYFVRPRK